MVGQPLLQGRNTSLWFKWLSVAEIKKISLRFSGKVPPVLTTAHFNLILTFYFPLNFDFVFLVPSLYLAVINLSWI